MKISGSIKNNIIRISLDGRLDGDSSPILDNYLRKYISEKHNRLIISMENVEFVSSMGLRIFVSVIKELRGKYRGDLRITNLQPFVRQVFYETGLDRLLKVYKNIEEAQASFLE